MLAARPPLGWNSWNTFGADVNETVVLEAAEALVRTGLRESGYLYVVIDDVWQADTRTTGGELQADPDKFPRGIGPLAQDIHAMGLQFGIYTCAGTHTCADRVASYGHEWEDARTFAGWGVDFLKVDFCNVPPGVDGPMLYHRMGQALRESGREIVFSACEWGIQQPWKWGRAAGCHLWRTTGDIGDGWESILRIGFRNVADWAAYGGPNGWNDLDMLVVGIRGGGNVGQDHCTDAEYRVHFAQWCLQASPLMIGCDLRQATAGDIALLGHAGLLEINQDPLGVSARRIAPAEDLWDWADLPVYRKPMADGSLAIGIFNLTERDRKFLSVAWETLGLRPDQPYRVTDVIAGQPLGTHRGSIAVPVAAHDVAVLRLFPVAGP
ncbi:MAG: glycoside hydrolase family 27 protein [Fimbriimonadaceae bacterium]|nr:glycoside hydrolase family 27 protein [Fimbriimonadaceae bacterium]